MTNVISKKYSIVGVGETEYSLHSGRSTRALAVEAVRKAMVDAGLTVHGIDGLMSYHQGDSTPSSIVASDLGIRPNFFMDVSGGGSTAEALIGLAIGAMEVGMCHTVAIFRSMNGYSAFRMGGTGAVAAMPVTGPEILFRSYGLVSAAQRYAFIFTRHMMEFGVTPEQLARIKMAQSAFARNNPKALKKERVTVEDVLNSRWIVKPVAHLLDCCLETDGAACMIVTSSDRAADLRQRLVFVKAVQGRVCKPRPEAHYQTGPMGETVGTYIASRIFTMAGIAPDEVDITGSYDAFTYTALLQFEDFGFCKKGEGKDYVTSGVIQPGGRRPSNTSGGQLCEGYTHGLNLVIENVRQLRGQADDYCPHWQHGVHTFDYGEGRCRQVKDAEIAMNMGWGGPNIGSALILAR